TQAETDTDNKSVYDQLISALNDRKKVYGQYKTAEEYNKDVTKYNISQEIGKLTFEEKQKLLDEKKKYSDEENRAEKIDYLENYALNVGYDNSAEYQKEIDSINATIAQIEKAVGFYAKSMLPENAAGITDEQIKAENVRLESEIARANENKARLREQLQQLERKKGELLAAETSAKVVADVKTKTDFNDVASSVSYADAYHAFGGDGALLFENMTEDEKSTYKYILRTEGEDEANKFFDTLRPMLNKKQEGKDVENFKKFADIPVISSVVTLGSQFIDGTVMAPVKFIGSLTGDYEKSYASYDKLTNFTTTVRSERAADWVNATGWEWAGFLYNTAMSLGDMAVAIAVSKGIGAASAAANSEKVIKTLSQIIMSSEAATNTMTDARKRGLDGWQIASLGVASAAVEAVTEKYSLDEILGTGKNVAVKTLRSAFTEASEETFSNILNTAVDELFAGDKSAMNTRIRDLMSSGMSYKEAAQQAAKEKVEEIGSDFLAGILTGGIMGGGSAIIQKAKTVQYAAPSTKVQSLPDVKAWVLEKFGKQKGTVDVDGVGKVTVDADSIMDAVGQSENADSAVMFLALNRTLKKGTVVTDTMFQDDTDIKSTEAPRRAVVVSKVTLNGNDHVATVSLAQTQSGEYIVNGITMDGETIYDASTYAKPVQDTAAENGEVTAKLVEGNKQTDGRFDYQDVAKISQSTTPDNFKEPDIDYAALEKYDQRKYTNHGWVTVNRVLTGNEQTKLYSQWADATENKYKYPRTPKGETIITVGDAYGDANVLVFISGTNQNPIISEIVRIEPRDRSDVSEMREMLIEGEENGDVYIRDDVESIFGEGILVSKQVSDFPQYRNLKGSGENRQGNLVGNGDRTLGDSGRGSNPSDTSRNKQVVKRTNDNSGLPSDGDGPGSVAIAQNSDSDVLESRSYDYTESAENWTAERLNDGSDGELLSAADIVADIEKTFGVPINKGNIQQKNAAGIFKTKINAIRTKLGNALPTICHEIGHLLDKNYRLSSLPTVGEAVDVMKKRNPQFAALYAEHQQKGEAIAEFVREYMRDRSAAKERYPKFFDAFINAVGKDLGKLNAVSDEVNAYLHSSVSGRIAANTTNRTDARKEKLSFGERLMKKAENALDLFADDVRRIENVSEEAYRAVYDSRKSATIVDIVIGEGMVDVNGDYVEGWENIGLGRVLEPIAEDYEDFNTYLTSKRALDLLDLDVPVFNNGDPTLKDKEKLELEIDKLEAKHPQ
ncbi:MAG: hypothetical protein IIU73_00190, partial [Selenomonadales bacterium]|nr:hypothetical protein [Selenomonadales bacterium]